MHLQILLDKPEEAGPGGNPEGEQAQAEGQPVPVDLTDDPIRVRRPEQFQQTTTQNLSQEQDARADGRRDAQPEYRTRFNFPERRQNARQPRPTEQEQDNDSRGDQGSLDARRNEMRGDWTVEAVVID